MEIKKIEGMTDTGAREQHKEGGVREPSSIEEGDYSLISPIMLERLAVWCAKGAEKYERRNWEKGLSLDGCLDSCLRHINKYRQGRRDEDHLIAGIWNLMAIVHLLDTHPELNNIPNYENKNLTSKTK